MTPSILRAAGEALYGPLWQSALARDIDVTDRTMRRWVGGDNPIPENVGRELRALLKARGLAMAAVRRKLPR